MTMGFKCMLSGDYKKFNELYAGDIELFDVSLAVLLEMGKKNGSF